MPNVIDASPVYAKAPIVEAVIDIQAQVPDDDADKRLLKFAELIAERFPQKSPLQMVSMNLNADGSHNMDRQDLGWRLVSEANDRIVQVRRQGFTYSHMPPYTQWSVFEGEAKPLWQRFVETCQPEKVTRVAVRYINRLRLPAGAIQLEDYLTINPQVPAVCEPIEGLLLQVQSRHLDVDPMCRSVITVASEVATDTNAHPMVLDIDVSVETSLGPQDSHCWTLLEKLRFKKNQLFEGSITDNVRRTFK